MNGVHVHRLPMLPRRDGAPGRTVHYLGFALAFLTAGLFHRRPDAVLAFSSTPMFGGAAAALLARAKRCPLVYVVQDVYPEIAQAMGVVRTRTIAAIARRLDAIAWRSAARVVVIGDDLRGVAGARRVDGARVSVIPNWADVKRIRPMEGSSFRSELGYSPGEFVVEYAGNFGRSQDLQVVLEAARLVERAGEEQAHARRIRFLLVGTGSASDDVHRRAQALGNVSVAPYQPEERLGDVLAAADLSLVPLRSGLTRYCVPSKIYSILASGRPVGAALDEDSEVARIVGDAGCGFRVDPDDPAAMAREILALAADPGHAHELGRNGRAWSERVGSLERATAEYEALLSEVTEGVKAEPPRVE